MKFLRRCQRCGRLYFGEPAICRPCFADRIVGAGAHFDLLEQADLIYAFKVGRLRKNLARPQYEQAAGSKRAAPAVEASRTAEDRSVRRLRSHPRDLEANGPPHAPANRDAA